MSEPPDDLYFDLKAGWQGQFTPTGGPTWGVVTPDGVGFGEWLNETFHEAMTEGGPPEPGWQATFAPSAADAAPLTAHKVPAHVEVPHELLVDSDPMHVCGPACPVDAPPGPLSRRRRARLAARRVRRRLARVGGLRIAHRDRIDQADE